ncbi:hypothetical protein Hanom_Chr03g00211771 [Helianthus anomalus]
MQLNWYELFLLSSDTTCRIVFRPERVDQKSLSQYERRNQSYQVQFNAQFTFNCLYIDSGTFTIQKTPRQSFAVGNFSANSATNVT